MHTNHPTTTDRCIYCDQATPDGCDEHEACWQASATNHQAAEQEQRTMSKPEYEFTVYQTQPMHRALTTYFNALEAHRAKDQLAAKYPEDAFKVVREIRPA